MHFSLFLRSLCSFFVFVFFFLGFFLFEYIHILGGNLALCQSTDRTPAITRWRKLNLAETCNGNAKRLSGGVVLCNMVGLMKPFCKKRVTRSRTAFYFCNSRNDHTGDKNKNFTVKHRFLLVWTFPNKFRPFLLHGATPTETCFPAALHRRFS